MTAGMNRRVNIWRFSTPTDDVVGGAVLTGTVVHYNLPFRMQADPDEQLLLQQGLETEKTFSAIVVPGTLDIRERDEVEIIAPIDDVYYQKHFRILSVRFSDHNTRDPRNRTLLKLSRSERAHRNYPQ